MEGGRLGSHEVPMLVSLGSLQAVAVVRLLLLLMRLFYAGIDLPQLCIAILLHTYHLARAGDVPNVTAASRENMNCPWRGRTSFLPLSICS